MSILFRMMACAVCVVGVSLVTKDLVPTNAARSGSDRSTRYMTPCAINAVLLARPDVQCELGIDDLKSEQVHEWLLAIKEDAKVHYPSLSSLKYASEKELEMYQQRVREIVQLELDRSEAGLPDLLNMDQMQRLRQLSLQREGLLAFQRQEIIDSLGLTVQQQEQIEELPRLGLSPHASRDSWNRCREDLSKVFTAKQRQAWQTLCGEVFLFDHAVPVGLEEDVLAALTGVPTGRQ